ncbi:MAG: hypothetical protein ACETWG_03605 [Candidatus Neomarinimicrobiota bacterium]
MTERSTRLLCCRLSWIILALTISVVYGQTHKLAIGTGRLQLSVASAFADKGVRLAYPREYEVYSLNYRYIEPDCADGGGIIIAAPNFQAKAYYPNETAKPIEWTLRDTLLPYVVADATAWYTTDIAHTTVPVNGGARRYWKYRPPVRIVDGEDLSLSDWQEGKDIDGPPDMPTAQMGLAVCNTYLGMTVTEQAYVFDNAEFVIVEYVFKYTGQTGSYDGGEEITYSAPINDCYVGIKFRPVMSGGTENERVVPNSGGWKEGTDEWVDYVHTVNGENLRILYGWDSDASAFHQAEDDEGDPLIKSSGLFTASQYPGMAVLHADQSPDDHSNDPDQPYRFYVSSGGTFSDNALTMGRNLSFEDIYKKLDEGPDSPRPFDWEGWINAGYPSDDASFWYHGTPHAEIENRFNQMGTLGFGPYNFDLGDSVRIILCYAAGTISWEQAIDVGAQYKDGLITKGEKNRILRSGRDSLFAKISLVRDLFDQAFVARGGDLTGMLKYLSTELGVAPAWPDRLVLRPIVGGCRVEWSLVEGADAYRVYRRSRGAFDLAVPSKEPVYSLVYQAGGKDPGEGVEFSTEIDSTVWIDRNTYPVFNYWYFVTAVGPDGLESSHFIGRTYPKTTDYTYGSCQPYERERFTLDEVHVIPNPYNVKSWEQSPVGAGWPENRLMFLGLPANCRIRIFSQSGTLIFRDYHRSGADLPVPRYNWDMRSSTDQTVASGMYIYVIDECTDFNGNEIKDVKVGKFVVIK